jgi:hypothetical protein
MPFNAAMQGAVGAMNPQMQRNKQMQVQQQAGAMGMGQGIAPSAGGMMGMMRNMRPKQGLGQGNQGMNQGKSKMGGRFGRGRGGSNFGMMGQNFGLPPNMGSSQQQMQPQQPAYDQIPESFGGSEPMQQIDPYQQATQQAMSIYGPKNRNKMMGGGIGPSFL